MYFHTPVRSYSSFQSLESIGYFIYFIDSKIKYVFINARLKDVLGPLIEVRSRQNTNKDLS